jgi:hypothetical protein
VGVGEVAFAPADMIDVDAGGGGEDIGFGISDPFHATPGYPRENFVRQILALILVDPAALEIAD